MDLFTERLVFISEQPERVERWRREWQSLSPEARERVRIDASKIVKRRPHLEKRLAMLAAVIRHAWAGALLTSDVWAGWLADARAAAEGVQA